MQSLNITLDHEHVARLQAGKKLKITFTAKAPVGGGLKAKILANHVVKPVANTGVEFSIPRDSFPEFKADVRKLNEQLRASGEKRSNLKKVSVYGGNVKLHVKRTYPQLTKLIEKYGTIANA